MGADEIYRCLVENQDFIVYQINADSVITYVSPSIEHYSGYTVGEFIGQLFTRFIHPEDLPEVMTRFQATISGTPGLSEFRALHKDGSVRWMRASSRPPKSGPSSGMIGIMTDITERKRMEEALREAGELNRQIVASVSEGIAVLDRDLCYIVWNPYLEEHTGLSASQVMGRHPWELFPDLAKLGIDGLLRKTLAGETTIIPDMWSKSPGAPNPHWIAGEQSPLKDSRGNVKGVIVTVRDITWRKRSEDALRESEDRYRDLAENSQDLLCVHDLEGKLLWVNPAPARALGYGVEEMVGKSLRDFMDPSYHGQLDEYLVRIQKNGVAKPYFAVVTRSGEHRIWECYNTLRTEGVPAPVVRGMARDVTERVNAERRLRKSEERFRVAVKTAPLTVFNQDKDLRYTWIYNPRLVWADQDSMGKTDAEIVGEEVAKPLTSLKRKVLQTNVGARSEWSITYQNKRHYFDTTVEPLVDSTGNIIGITGARVDITELKEKSEQLRALSKKLAQEKLYLESEIEEEHKFEEIVGESAVLKDALSQVTVVAATDSTVLILGETGTGKELVARAVHRMSPRKENGFIKLNCAAIPTGLLESELFGHERGAFTGAVSQKVGRLELADKGTLFLDEVGDIPLALQPKLLRVLQDQEFERLGGTRTIKVNVRLIAATNKDLAKSMSEKEFRSDLFYRINVFPIHLPTLRERRDDIPALVRHFVHKYASRMNKKIESIPRDTMRALSEWDWPGNIRELENFIERSVILTKGAVLSVPLSELSSEHALKADSLEAAERDYIIRILRECNGVIAGPDGAAVKLGLKRTTLQSKMQRLGITRSDYEGERRGRRTGT
jgi:PAS domain S-box-containing protein